MLPNRVKPHVNAIHNFHSLFLCCERLFVAVTAWSSANEDSLSIVNFSGFSLTGGTSPVSTVSFYLKFYATNSYTAIRVLRL